jgi:tricorn protease
MMFRHYGFVLLMVCVACAGQASEADHTRLLRYPDISATQISFVYGGDLYVVARKGGDAIKLTSSVGQELYPKFSPDGRWIAYSAEYSGTRQVFVIPTTGGVPKQLTFYSDAGSMPFRGGTDYRVLDWTPDGQHIVVRMNRLPYDERAGRPYLVPVAGGMEKPMVIPESGGGSLSPDGTQFVYTPIDADWRGWKRYRGGRAPDVWIYDLKNNVSRQLTNFVGMDMNPAWVKDEIFFASDRTGTLNLYAQSAQAVLESAAPRAITQFTDFDVLWPSGGPDAVVFEQGGYIWRYDVGVQHEAVRVPIRVASDLPETLPAFVKVGAFIDSASLSPQGERAVFAARGEIVTVPAKQGEPRNISLSPAARETSVSWSPDGQWIAYLSDASGEYEIYVRAQDGSGEPRRITQDGDIWRYPPVWSPDSKKLAFADKKIRLRYVDVGSGKLHEVDHSVFDDMTEYTWSPDSRWLAYSKTNATRMQSIWVHHLSDGKNTQLTSDQANEFSPVFDPKGRYLYFLSNREYSGLTFSSYEFNYLYTNSTRIYAATLAADGPALNRPKSDEVKAQVTAIDAKPKDDKKDKNKTLKFDLSGFNARTVALNMPAGNYQALSANDAGVFFLSGDAQQGELALQHFGLDAEKPEVIASAVSLYTLSPNGEKALVRVGNDFAIIDAKPGQDPAKSKLLLDKLELRIDPRVEWPQIYTDAWRILRDWFYDPNMHGGIKRWNTIRDRYAALLPYVATREDLNYVLHEVAGEANAGHVYVERGSATASPIVRKPGGMLGAEFSADASGYFRIDKIFAGENWNPENRSPLTEPGVKVSEGEYLIAIDQVDTRSVSNLYQLLENKAERVVELKINSKPTDQAARTVRVKTISSEENLRYLDWVAQRRAKVEKLGGGRIGYMHIPNTSQNGNRELNKWMAPLAHYEALIIDDRYNGGGFIPDRMIEILARTPLNYWKRRGLEPQPTPGVMHRGPKAMLINGLSSSGGDALPYYFRKLKLGTLIGTRTWGGLIGISGNPSVVDGGTLLAANFRFMDTNNQWAVENEGVAPDIEVVDRPEQIAMGNDPSLEKAIEVLLAELKNNPVPSVVAPPAPSEFK